MRIQNPKSIMVASVLGFVCLSAFLFGAFYLAGTLEQQSTTQGLRPDLADSGSADEIREVKEEILSVLEREQEWGNLTKPDIKQIVERPDSEFTQRWETNAYSIWVQSVAESNIKAVEKMFAQEGDYSLDNSWKKLSVEVVDWQGVVLEGDSVTAQFVQQNRMQRAHGERVTPPVQWRATFKRSSDTGQLLISSKLGIDLENFR